MRYGDRSRFAGMPEMPVTPCGTDMMPSVLFYQPDKLSAVSYHVYNIRIDWVLSKGAGQVPVLILLRRSGATAKLFLLAEVLKFAPCGAGGDSPLFFLGKEDGDIGVDLVFGAHFTVLIKERHFNDRVKVAVMQFVMLEQAANGTGSAQEQHPARF